MSTTRFVPRALRCTFALAMGCSSPVLDVPDEPTPSVPGSPGAPGELGEQGMGDGLGKDARSAAIEEFAARDRVVGAKLDAALPSDVIAPGHAGLYGTPFVHEGQHSFAFDGTTDLFAVPLPAGAGGIVLRTTPTSGSGGKNVCFQIDSAVDSEGGVWIPPATTHEDWQSSCTTCKQRAHVGRGYGLFAFPNNGELIGAASSLTMRVALRDCATYLPFNPAFNGAPPSGVNVEVLSLPQPSAAPGHLKVAFVFPRGGAFASETASSNAPLENAITTIQDQFASAQLDIEVAYADMPSSGKVELMFGNDDQQELDALAASAKSAMALALSSAPSVPSAVDRRTTVPVIFAPCLVQRDEGGTHSLHAYVPRIPSGFATGNVADAIFVEEGNCNTRPPTARQDGTALGKLIAHELGHYLGLYHTVEADTRTDHLADTDGANLMHFNPLLSTSAGLSASQIRVLRMHPYIEYP